METLLVFLAIVAIQVIAAKLKQKKKPQRQQEPVQERIPEESAPVPDPFRELREMLGLPEQEQEQRMPEPLPKLHQEIQKPVQKPVEKNEEFMPLTRAEKLFPDHPFVPITSKKAEVEMQKQIESAEISPLHVEQKKKNFTSNVAYGIIWTAVLQEPRFRKRWKYKC